MEINFELLPIQMKTWNYLFDDETNNIVTFFGTDKLALEKFKKILDKNHINSKVEKL